jgi:predicted phage terminase large subunit-like protein
MISNIEYKNRLKKKESKIFNTEDECFKTDRRCRVLNGDFKFFCYYYFPHHMFGKSSVSQKLFFARFPKLIIQEEGCIEWFIAPRGEAKTTLLTKLGPIFVVILGLLQKLEIQKEIDYQNDLPPFIDYILLLGAETRFPTKLVEVIKTELIFNSKLKQDFPEIAKKGEIWNKGEIITRNSIKIEAFGAEQAIRGTFHNSSRPGLLLGDDLITDKEAKSPTERDNRWNWYNQAVTYLGKPDGNVKAINVATVLNCDDPVSRAKQALGHVVHHSKAIISLPNRMDLWEKCEELMRNEDIIYAEKHKEKVLALSDYPSYKFYFKNKRKMDKGAVTSWPAVRSLFWLMRQRADNRKAFDAEMQGEPRSDQDKVFTQLKYWVQHNENWINFGACDPSMGKNEKSHPSAILIGGLDRLENKLYILEADIKRRVPSKLKSDLIKWQKQYQCQTIAFENVNAYEHMRLTFVKEASQEGIILPLRGISINIPKETRIESLEPYICGLEPQILFHSSQSQLLNELLDWPEKQSQHDFDGLDALYLLYTIAIKNSYSKKVFTKRKLHSSRFKNKPINWNKY